MSIESKKLRETQIGLQKEIQNLASVVRSSDEGTYSAEQKAQHQKMIADIATLNDKAESLEMAEQADILFKANSNERSSNVSAYSPELNPSKEEQDDAFRAWALHGASDSKNVAREYDGYVRSAERCGVNYNSPDMYVRATQVVGTANKGGYSTQNELLQQIVKAQLAYGSVRQVAKVISTGTGTTLPYPTLNDTANTGELVTEGGTYNAQDLTFGIVNIGAYKFSSKSVKISTELLQDTSLNITEIIGSALGERLGRIQDSYHTTGTGSSQPQGLVYGATVGVTAAATTAFTYAELVTHMMMVDPAYQASSKWVVSKDFWTKCMLLEDDNGRPLLNSSLDGIGGGFSMSLLGKPVIVNNTMAAATAALLPAIYGQFDPYFVIRDVSDVRIVRQDELYSENDLVGFVAFQRSSSAIVAATSSTPFLTFKMHA